MEAINNQQTPERRKYVSAGMKVIEINPCRVLCYSKQEGPQKLGGNNPWIPSY